MQYKVQNVTMHIDRASGEYAGDCMFYIPFNHVKFMIDGCGMEVNRDFASDDYNYIFSHAYGEIYMNKSIRKYYSQSVDLLIMYLAWLLDQEGPQEVEVEYSNAFWAIHDFEHALNDESGCTIYVDEHIEYQRINDTFDLMKKHGHEITYEILEEVTEAFNGRFGLTGSKAKSFDHHFDWAEEEEEYV